MSKKDYIEDCELYIYKLSAILQSSSYQKTKDDIVIFIKILSNNLMQIIKEDKATSVIDNDLFNKGVSLLRKDTSPDQCVDTLYNIFIIKYLSLIENRFNDRNFDFFKDYLVIMSFLCCTPDYATRGYNRHIQEYLMSFLGE